MTFSPYALVALAEMPVVNTRRSDIPMTRDLLDRAGGRGRGRGRCRGDSDDRGSSRRDLPGGVVMQTRQLGVIAVVGRNSGTGVFGIVASVR